MASWNFLSPTRVEPKVMQRGRFFPEPMLSNSDKVNREAIVPPRASPVTINLGELLICISIVIRLKAEQQYMLRIMYKIYFLMTKFTLTFVPNSMKFAGSLKISSQELKYNECLDLGVQVVIELSEEN